jgi:hypothetical protein
MASSSTDDAVSSSEAYVWKYELLCSAMSAREGEGPVASGVSALSTPDSVDVVRVGDEAVRATLP